MNEDMSGDINNILDHYTLKIDYLEQKLQILINRNDIKFSVKLNKTQKLLKKIITTKNSYIYLLNILPLEKTDG